MKAKEYDFKFRNTLKEKGETEAVKELVFSLIDEIQFLQNSRRAKTNDAGIAIIREIINKWKAIVRLVNDPDQILKPDGFEKFLEQHTGIKITPTGFEEIKK